jgi:hypothetical protein
MGIAALIAIAIWIPTSGRNQGASLPAEYRVTVSPLKIVEEKKVAPTQHVVSPQDRSRTKDAQDLRKRVFALQAKLMQAQQASPIGGLENPNFEIQKSIGKVANGKDASDHGASPVFGWQIPKEAADQFEVISASNLEASSNLIDGQPKSYLTISNATEAATWIRSNRIEAPNTRRLSIAVWLRASVEGATEKPAAAPKLRVALDAKIGDKDFYRFAEVAEDVNRRLKESNETNPSVIGNQWKRFAIHFEDLPSGVSALRIGFDLMNASKVDIGRVQIYDRWFDDEEAQAITQLLASVDALLQHPDKVVQCRQLLNDDWAIFLDKHFKLKPPVRNARLRIPMFQRQTGRQR